MRAANFRRAYLWFKVADNRKDEVDEIQSMILSEGMVVNYPKKECGAVSDNEKKPEAVLERKLVDRDTDHGRWSFLARYTIM